MFIGKLFLSSIAFRIYTYMLQTVNLNYIVSYANNKFSTGILPRD